MAICWSEIRERPQCRVYLNRILEQKHTLNEVINSNNYSKNIKTQARKMLEEQENLNGRTNFT